MLPTGLGIYESLFIGVGNTRGCIGGPHEVFLQCEKQFVETNNVAQFNVFLEKQIKLFNTGMKVCLDCNAFDLNHVDSGCSLSEVVIPKQSDSVVDSKVFVVDTIEPGDTNEVSEKPLQNVLVVRTAEDCELISSADESNLAVQMCNIAVVEEEIQIENHSFSVCQKLNNLKKLTKLVLLFNIDASNAVVVLTVVTVNVSKWSV